MNNKKKLIIIGLVVAALVLLFCLGGPGIRSAMLDIIGSAVGVDTAEATPTESVSIADATKVPTESPAENSKPTQKPATNTPTPAQNKYVTYKFRNNKLLTEHYEKHGIEMGFKNAAEYEKAACDVINNPDALHKTEKEDGDFVYYIVKTNEFVILSKDGYIRTYFLPSAGLSYYNRQ